MNSLSGIGDLGPAVRGFVQHQLVQVQAGAEAVLVGGLDELLVAAGKAPRARRAAAGKHGQAILQKAAQLVPGSQVFTATPGSVPLGSSGPRMRRWALDEMGRNSVNPSTIPSTTDKR